VIRIQPIAALLFVPGAAFVLFYFGIVAGAVLLGLLLAVGIASSAVLVRSRTHGWRRGRR
jgi:hypothetical protein